MRSAQEAFVHSPRVKPLNSLRYNTEPSHFPRPFQVVHPCHVKPVDTWRAAKSAVVCHLHNERILVCTQHNTGKEILLVKSISPLVLFTVTFVIDNMLALGSVPPHAGLSGTL